MAFRMTSAAETAKGCRFAADLHTHTIASTHAFNTVTEMARAAAEKGFWAIALTDHGPAMPDSPHPWYFYTLRDLPSRMEGVWVLKGAEANVTDKTGAIDFSEQELDLYAFDWLTASVHADVVGTAMTEDECTQLWLRVAENPYVDMIGHSETPAFRYDYDAAAAAFAARGKVVELNANSCSERPGGEGNMTELALACKKAGTKIAVNSDAHSIYRLGDFSSVLPVLRKVDFPRELIVNADRKTLIEELKRHGKPIAEKMEEKL